MSAITLLRFDGMRPAWDDRMLDNMQASYSRDAYLYSGALQGWIAPTLLWTLKNSSASMAFRIPSSSSTPSNVAITAPSYWLEFNDPDTNVIRTPVVDDTFQRYYWASPSQAPMYNTLARIAAGNANTNAPFLLGLPIPNCTPVVNVTGGSTAPTTRTYVITWVTAYGEESGPSAYALANGFADSTWQIGLTIPPLASDMNLTVPPTRFIQYVNIYRTVVSAGGSASYFFVAQLPISTTTYTDTLADNVVALNNQLITIGWGPPPSDLQGIISMPNGFFAGFRKNEVWFSQPFYPHSWPTNYILTTRSPIVGLGITGNMLVACTESAPEAFTGTAPSVMSPINIGTTSYPCLSRGSIVGTEMGVFYSSAAGIVVVSPSGFPAIFTEGWITREKWAALVPPIGIRAVNLLSSYFAFGSVVNIPAVAATATAVVNNLNVNPNDTILIGMPGNAVTYTFIAGPPVFAYQVDIGSTITQTAQNLVDAINDAGQSNANLYGVEYGAGTIVHPSVSASTDNVKTITLTALTAGSAGNSIVLSTTSSKLTLSGPTLVGGVNAVNNTAYAQQGFTIDFGTAINAVRWLGFGLLSAPNAQNILNLTVDPWSGVVLMVQNGGVYQYDWTNPSPVTMPWKWRSKVFKQDFKRSLEAAKIHFIVPPGTATQETTRNTGTPQTLASNQYGIFRVYAGPIDPDAPSLQDATQVPDTVNSNNLTLVLTRDIFNSGEILRLPSGAKYNFWQFEFEGRVIVTSVEVASTVAELRQI